MWSGDLSDSQQNVPPRTQSSSPYLMAARNTYVNKYQALKRSFWLFKFESERLKIFCLHIELTAEVAAVASNVSCPNSHNLGQSSEADSLC